MIASLSRGFQFWNYLEREPYFLIFVLIIESLKTVGFHFTTCQQLTVISCYDKLFEMDYAIMSQAGKRNEVEVKTNKKIFSIMRKAEKNLKKVNVKC